MPDPKHLPYLLNLLDDESDAVKKTVYEELKAFGATLRQELTRLPHILRPRQQELLKEFWQDQAGESLKARWSTWFKVKNDRQKLEFAFRLLAEFQGGLEYRTELKTLLDQLAVEYIERYGKKNPYRLGKFLFQDKQLRGMAEDYYNPQNSNLAYVIEEGRGLPISLVSIFMLVGKRLSLKIEGCNTPGHFLAKFQDNEDQVLVDCFNGGRIIDREEAAVMFSRLAKNIDEVLSQEVTAEKIIQRVLNNLTLAYRKQDYVKNSRLMMELKHQLDDHISLGEGLSSADLKKYFKHPDYDIGQIIRHKRYGYRGLVIDFDLSCQADDEWYYSNLTQPKKDQPWYHVLVHKSNQITYAAESSLRLDHSQKEVMHPLVPYFFKNFKNGRYVRNSQPWPRTDDS